MTPLRAIAALLLLVCLAWFSQACTLQAGACASTTGDTCNVAVTPETDCWATPADGTCYGEYVGSRLECTAPIVNPSGIQCRPAIGKDGIIREAFGGYAPAWCCK